MTKAKKKRIQAALNALRQEAFHQTQSEAFWGAIQEIQREIGVEVKLKVKREVPHAVGS